jgi:hypothetical protein
MPNEFDGYETLGPAAFQPYMAPVYDIQKFYDYSEKKQPVYDYSAEGQFKQEFEIIVTKLRALAVEHEISCEKVVDLKVVNLIDYFEEHYFEANFYFPQNLQAYGELKKYLEIIIIYLEESSLNVESKKTSLKDFLDNLYTCGPGIFSRAEDLCYKLTGNHTINSWLLKFRREIVNHLSCEHCRKVQLDPDMEIHTLPLFLISANNCGWELPVSDVRDVFARQEGAIIDSSVIINFQGALKRHYSMLTIVDRVCLEIKGLLSSAMEKFGQDGKVTFVGSDSGYQDFIKEVELILGDTEIEFSSVLELSEEFVTINLGDLRNLVVKDLVKKEVINQFIGALYAKDFDLALQAIRNPKIELKPDVIEASILYLILDCNWDAQNIKEVAQKLLARRGVFASEQQFSTAFEFAKVAEVFERYGCNGEIEKLYVRAFGGNKVWVAWLFSFFSSNQRAFSLFTQQNFDVFSKEHCQYGFGIYNQLIRIKTLNQTVFDVVCYHGQYCDEYYSVCHVLSQNKIALFSREESGILISKGYVPGVFRKVCNALIRLNRSTPNLLTLENRAVIFKHFKHIKAIDLILEKLESSGFFYQEYFEKIFCYDGKYIDIISCQVGLLNSEIWRGELLCEFNIICEKAHVLELINKVVCELKTAEIYSEQNVKIVTGQQYCYTEEKGADFNCLNPRVTDEEGYFTLRFELSKSIQENGVSCKQFEFEKFWRFAESLDKIFNLIRERSQVLFTAENITAICRNAEYAYGIFNQLISLLGQGDISQEGFDEVCCNAERYDALHKLIANLTTKRILTVENKQTICSLGKPQLVKLAKIKHVFRGQESVGLICRHIQHADKIDRAIHLLLIDEADEASFQSQLKAICDNIIVIDQILGRFKVTMVRRTPRLYFHGANIVYNICNKPLYVQSMFDMLDGVKETIFPYSDDGFDIGVFYKAACDGDLPIEQFASVVDLLKEKNICVDIGEFRWICTHTARMARIFKKLKQKHALFTQENVKAICKIESEDVEKIISIFDIIDGVKKDIFSFADDESDIDKFYKVACESSLLVDKLIYVVNLFKEKSIRVDIEEFEWICKHTANIAQIFEVLEQNPDLFTRENVKAICKIESEYVGQVSFILYVLQQQQAFAASFSQADLNVIFDKTKEIRQVIEALIQLDAHSVPPTLIVSDSLVCILGAFKDKDATHTDKIVKMFKSLVDAQEKSGFFSLTKANLKQICEQAKYADRLTKAVDFFANLSPHLSQLAPWQREIAQKHLSFFTQSNFEKICDHAIHADRISKLLGVLSGSELLTQLNFEKVCEYAMYADKVARLFKGFSSLRWKCDQLIFEQVYKHIKAVNKIVKVFVALEKINSQQVRNMPIGEYNPEFIKLTLTRDFFNVLYQHPEHALAVVAKINELSLEDKNNLTQELLIQLVEKCFSEEVSKADRKSPRKRRSSDASSSSSEGVQASPSAANTPATMWQQPRQRSARVRGGDKRPDGGVAPDSKRQRGPE